MFVGNVSRQQGVALIQVLLITAILSVLALYLTSTAKDQIKVAQWADDKAYALVAQHGAESELIFSLLTQNRTQSTTNANLDGAVSVSQKWNFYDNPFSLNNLVTVKIQDQAGLIHAHFPNEKHLKKLIAYSGETSSGITAIADNLLDWQDLDSIPRVNGDERLNNKNEIRNGAVPTVHDFFHVNRMTPELFNLLKSNMTVFRQGIFNPMNAPEELLSALTSQTIASQVIELRNTNQLTNRLFSQLTGIVENDSTIFYPSNFLELTLESKVGESVVKKEIIIQVMPYASGEKMPINIFSNRG